MTTVLKPLPLYRRPEELARRVVGALLQFVLAAYGTAAALSVALSSSDTVGGKAADAVRAVPNLSERYDQARYVAEHREQIQSTLDYARDNAPDAQQLDAAVQRSTETVRQVSTTFEQVTQHVQAAWAGRPSLQSIKDLEVQTQNAQAFITQLNLQDPTVRRIYADSRSVLDNFASDEIGATLGVMGVALAVTWVLSLAVGFWSRRGRPGFVAGTLQRWGALRFRPWYARNLEHAMGAPMYAVARERIQRDIVADPETLDPEALAELERWFEHRRAIKPKSSTR